jgi:hypothetical protein
MDLFHIVLPWEQRAGSVSKSAAKYKPTLRKFAPTAIAFGLLLVIGIGWWWTTQRRRPTSPAAPGAVHSANQKSIAVLPFENLSHDPENAYFADGIQEEHCDRLLLSSGQLGLKCVRNLCGNLAFHRKNIG